MAVWSTGRARDPIRITPSSTTIDLAIRLGFLGLLSYWSFRVIAPLLTIGLWSAILAVASVRSIGGTAGSSRRRGNCHVV